MKIFIFINCILPNNTNPTYKTQKLKRKKEIHNDCA